MKDSRYSDTGRVYLICVDSYEDRVMKGRICNAEPEQNVFSGMMQFLLKMEALLNDGQQLPVQTGTDPVSTEPLPGSIPALNSRKGRRATFELRIVFRQHGSWQGILNWGETRQKQSFRSVLEMLTIMDSALQKEKGCGCA